MADQIVYILEHREGEQGVDSIDNVVMHVASTLEKARAKVWELRHDLTLDPPSWYAVFPELVDSPDIVPVLPSDIGDLLEFYGPHGLRLEEQPSLGYPLELSALCKQESALTGLWDAKEYTEAAQAFNQLSINAPDIALAWYEHLSARDRSLLGQEALAHLLKNASRDQRIRLIALLPKAKQATKPHQSKKR